MADELSASRRARGAARKLLLAALATALALAPGGCGGGAKKSQAPTRPPALVAIGQGLTGPAGLHASVYAHGPRTLASLAFDPRGRLWLAAAGLSEHSADGVYVLAERGGSAVKVISGLDDPLGLLWLNGRLYVASVGRVDAYGGFDGRRFRTHAQILRGPVAGAENNYLALGPDGRLVMGVTATCDHCAPRSPLSGAIVGFRPDGSDLRVLARRIRAPVGLAYFPGSENLLASMNQRDDLGASTPGDWLALVRAGQDWRSPGCYGQGGAACAGAPKPLAVLDKHAAAGAVTVVTGSLGSTVGTAALVSEWASGKVLRVGLVDAGARAGGARTSFLGGVKNPLALALAPDGSLLVGDWSTGLIFRVGVS